MSVQLQYQVKVLSQDNLTYVADLPLAKEKSPPSFTSRLNAGQGECVLDLALPFDNFTEGTVIKAFNFVEIWVTDQNNTLGRRIYKGYISRYTPYIDESGEGVKVTCLGIGSMLTLSYYGTAPAYSVTQTSQDPETIAKLIIDNFNSAFGGSLISYAGSTSPVGTNVTKTYAQRKWMDALDDTVELALAGWWWYVDQDGLFSFKAKPTAETHVLTIGKDIVAMQAPKDYESVENEVIVTRNGGSQATYADATSQQTYGTGYPPTGRITKLINDSTIMDVPTSDQRGNKELADFKDGKVAPSVTINTNADIEGFKPGDCVRFANFNNASTFFGTNVLQVVGIEYRGETAVLQLENHLFNFGISLDKFVNA